MRKILSIILIIILIFSFTGCSNDTTMSRSIFCFNTYVEITLYDWEKETDTDDVLSYAISICKEYEAIFSKSIDTSDVSKINSSNGQSVAVNDATAKLLTDSIKYSELTNGAFDITVAPLVNLWDITSENPTIPTNEEINNAVSRINYKAININDNMVTIGANQQIDLGAIVKGYVADKIKDYLIKSGVTSAIIDLGGNILTIGSKGSDDFKIGIKKPFTESSEMIATIDVSGKSIVTSGVYERYFTKENHIYHHVFDTTTGYPTDNGLYSVTIISDSSEDGDVLSTSLLSLGLEKSINFLNSLDTNIQAIFVTDKYDVIVTDGLSIDENNNISLVLD